MKPQIVVAQQSGGLSNNLKCYLSAMRIAERIGGTLVTTSTDLVSIFTDLRYLPESKIEPWMKTHLDWRLIIFPDDPLEKGFSMKRESRGFPDADPQRRNIDHEFERIPPEIRELYLKKISELSIRPAIAKEIEEYIEKELDHDTVSIHMRTWMTDHWDKAPKRHELYFDFNYYKKLVEQFDRVFISSDNAEFLAKLRKLYGGRIKHYRPDGRFDPSQVAFIDLMILAQGKRLFGSSLSTFTEMAWWLGGCQASVSLASANS